VQYAGGVITSAAAGRISVSQTALYLLSYATVYNSTVPLGGNTALREVWAAVNGTNTTTAVSSYSTNVAVSASNLISLTTGEYVSLFTSQFTGAALSVVSPAALSLVTTSDEQFYLMYTGTPQVITGSLIGGTYTQLTTLWTSPMYPAVSRGGEITNPSPGVLQFNAAGAFIVTYAYSMGVAASNSYKVVFVGKNGNGNFNCFSEVTDVGQVRCVLSGEVQFTDRR